MARKTTTSSAVKNRYNAKAYDRINLVVPKGQKDLIKTHAEARGESTNAFINRAINETIEGDRAAGPTPNEKKKGGE